MHYERDASPGTNCKWDHPACEQITYYDATIKSVLSTSAREHLALGMLELERSLSVNCAWVDGFQVQSEVPQQRQQQQQHRSSAQCPWQGSRITARRSFSKGDFMGFALGRVMTASTADGVLAAAKTPAQLLELSGRMFRFVARPTACGNQQSSNAAAVSKQVAVLFSDKVEANPLAHARDYRHLCPSTSEVLSQGPGQANAGYLPLSFNVTGDVYVVVTALTDIAAGEEVTVDRGVVSYSRPMHDVIQTVMKGAETIQLREPTGPVGQQQQQQEQDYQQPSATLLKQQLAAALATCAQVTASSTSSNAGSSFAVLGDKLTKNLKQAVDICKQLPAAAAAAADVALPAAAGATSRSPAATKQQTPKKASNKAFVVAATQPAAGVHANKLTAAMPPQDQQQGSAPIGDKQVKPLQAAPSAQRVQPTGLLPVPAAAAAAVEPGATLQPAVQPVQPAVHAALNATPAAGGASATQQQQRLPLAVDTTGIAAAATRAGRSSVQQRPRRPSAATAAAAQAPSRSPSVAHAGPGGSPERGCTRRRAAKRAAAALHDWHASGKGSEDRPSSPVKKHQQRSSSGLASGQQQQLESRVQYFVQRLLSDNQNTQRTAAESLRCIARLGKQHCDVIAAAGAITTLVNLLSSDSSKCQCAAAGVLVNMTYHNGNYIQAVVTIDGSMKALLQLLHSSDKDLLASAADLLGNVLSAQEHRCHNNVITAGVVPVLTGHLRSSNSSLQLAAAIALQCLATTHPEAIGSEPLHLAATLTVPLLDSKDKYLRLKAWKTASCLADHPGIQPLVAAVPKAVHVLKSSDRGVHAYATSLLWGLGEQSNAVAVVQAEVLSQGAVPALVKLLSSSDGDVQHDAAGTIMVLARSNETIRVQAAGAVGPLTQMLSNSDSNILEDVVGALESLATGSIETQAAIAAVPAAVEQLRELSNSNSRLVVERATAVVKLLGIPGTAG